MVLTYIDFNKIKHLNLWISLFFLIFLLSSYSEHIQYLRYYLFPLIVIPIGLNYSKWTSFIPKKLGDMSYGIYIISFPVMQVLMHFFHLGQVGLFFYSTIVTLSLAFLSWHLIEKPALKLK